MPRWIGTSLLLTDIWTKLETHLNKEAMRHEYMYENR